MSSTVVDVLYIKTIEKTIGRKLDEIDLECIQFGEPLFMQDRNGMWYSFLVPLYRLPYDLMPTAVDIELIEQSTEYANFFDSVFKPVTPNDGDEDEAT